MSAKNIFRLLFLAIAVGFISVTILIIVRMHRTHSELQTIIGELQGKPPYIYIDPIPIEYPKSPFEVDQVNLPIGQIFKEKK